MISKLCVHS